jgi:hypothetical protein
VLNTEGRRARARLAARKRWHPGDDQITRECRAELEEAARAARLEAAIRAVVESAPALTQEQLTRLRALLAAPDSSEAAAS